MTNSNWPNTTQRRLMIAEPIDRVHRPTSTAECVARAKKERLCECVPCDKAFASQRDLDNHGDTLSHLQKANAFVANGGTFSNAPKPKGPSKNPAKLAIHQRNIRDKKYYCPDCDRAFGVKAGLTNHLDSKSHKAVIDAKEGKRKIKLLVKRESEGNEKMSGLRRRCWFGRRPIKGHVCHGCEH